MLTPRARLEQLYVEALTLTDTTLSPEQINNLARVASSVEQHKAIVTVLITSLLKKLEDPTQDVRQHKKGLTGGYSGRRYDTQWVTPFMQQHFARYAMAESGWLTRSLEQPQAFTLDFQGKVRDQEVKRAFLLILDDIETKQADPKAYLLALLRMLYHLQETHKVIFSPSQPFKNSVASVIAALYRHFFHAYTVRGAARLPVLALHAAYACMMSLPRYQDKQLLPLKSHTSADSKSNSVGDIVIVHGDGGLFEAVEVKHGKPITSDMLQQVYNAKIRSTSLARYYLLSTARPDIADPMRVTELAEHIQQAHGCEIIANGVIPSLTYYLRLLPDVDEFIHRYTQSLQEQFALGSEIKHAHLAVWRELLENLQTPP